MEHEDKIIEVLTKMNDKIDSLAGKDTINLKQVWTTVIGTVIVAIILGAFAGYRSSERNNVVFRKDIDANTKHIDNLDNIKANINDFNTHCVYDDYNFSILAKHTGVSLIYHNTDKYGFSE